MDQTQPWNSGKADLGPKIALVAAIIIAAMLLFPPKYVSSPSLGTGQTVTESAGYKFIFADPTDGASQSGIISGGISWGKLLLQIVVVGGLAAGASAMLKRK